MRIQGYNTRLYTEIVKFFENNPEHAFTVSQVFFKLKETNQRLNRTTVYRNLDKLEAEGRLLKYVTDDGRMASYLLSSSKMNCGDHLHLKCTDCGKIIHLDCSYVEQLRSHILRQHNFDLFCGSSILYGRCSACAQKDHNGK